MKERRTGISSLLALLVVVIIIGALFFIEIPMVSKTTSTTMTSTTSTTSTSSASSSTPVSSTGTLVLKIAQPFLIVAPNQGTSASMTFSVVGSVAGNYSFSASGLPSGVTAAFSPSSLSFPSGASSTVTVSLTAASGATIANATATFSATAGSSVYKSTFPVQSVGALVLMQGNQFMPSTLTVSAGTKVYWFNLDAVGGGEAAGGAALGHDVTSTSPSGLFSSGDGNLVQYAEYSYTFTSAGTVSYESKAQPTMTGQVTVTG